MAPTPERSCGALQPDGDQGSQWLPEALLATLSLRPGSGQIHVGTSRSLREQEGCDSRSQARGFTFKGHPWRRGGPGSGGWGACVGTRTCTFICLEWARGPWNSSDAWMFGARTGGHLTGGRTGTPKGGRPRRRMLGEGLGVTAAHGVGRPGLRPRLSPASWGVAVSPGQQQEAVPSSPPRTSARAHRARTVQGKGRAAGTRKLSVFASYPPAAWASQPFSGALPTCRRRILLPSSALRIAISTLAQVTHPARPLAPPPAPPSWGAHF